MYFLTQLRGQAEILSLALSEEEVVLVLIQTPSITPGRKDTFFLQDPSCLPPSGHSYLHCYLLSCISPMSQESKRRKPRDYHRKQSCRHRDIISCITNETGGKCHLLEAFFLEYKLTEEQISESSGEFLKLPQGNFPEHLGRSSMFRELVCFQFQVYFRDCYGVFKHVPNHYII